MQNYAHDGRHVTVPAPAGGVTSGQGVLIGKLFGVAIASASEDDPVVLVTEGVVYLPKASTQTQALGARLYWDAGNGQLTTAATGNEQVAIAVEEAANGTGTVKVKLARALATAA